VNICLRLELDGHRYKDAFRSASGFEATRTGKDGVANGDDLFVFLSYCNLY
jgi:hypothetical protein